MSEQPILRRERSNILQMPISKKCGAKGMNFGFSIRKETAFSIESYVWNNIHYLKKIFLENSVSAGNL